MSFDGFKVTRSVIGTKEGDLQYPYIYKLLLSLTHGHSQSRRRKNVLNIKNHLIMVQCNATTFMLTVLSMVGRNVSVFRFDNEDFGMVMLALWSSSGIRVTVTSSCAIKMIRSIHQHLTYIDSYYFQMGKITKLCCIHFTIP